MKQMIRQRNRGISQIIGLNTYNGPTNDILRVQSQKQREQAKEQLIKPPLNQLNHSSIILNLKMEILEKEGQGITTENVQITQPQSKKLKQTISAFLLDGKVGCFHIEQNNNFKSSIYFIIISLYLLTNVALFHRISDEAQSSVFSYGIQNFYDQVIFYLIVFVGLIVLKVLLVISVVMEIILKKEILAVSWLNRKCLNNYTILKELDLSISGIMVLVSWKENLAHLIVSGAITIFHAIYLQEYINRRDILYVSCSKQYILFRIYMFLSYIVNVVFLDLEKSYFAYYYLFASSILFIWYLTYGNELYIHKFSKNAFHIVISLFLTYYLVFIQNWIFNKSLISLNQSIKFMMAFFAFLAITKARLKHSFSKMSGLSISLQQRCPKIIDLQLFQLLEESITNKDSQVLLIGILHYFYDRKRKFPIDYFNYGSIYDSYLKENIARQAIYLQKETALRFYIKDIYEKSLDKREDTETLLEYCQFMVNEFNNVSSTLQLIQRAKRLSLNIVQRVKVVKMQLALLYKNQMLNRQIYDGNLEIEHIIEAEERFSQVQFKIGQYLQGSLDVWNSLQLQEIQMIRLRNALKNELDIIDQIDNLWKCLSKFFKNNKPWMLVYMHYVTLIQNEKIKQREVDFFSNDSDQDTIFDRQAIYFEKSTPQEKLSNSEIMFNMNSCCFFAAYQEEQLHIKDVNTRFTRMLGFTKEEIKGALLAAIMPHQIVEDHRLKFKEWITTGHLSNQASYHPRFTSFITKYNQQVPAVKYYKAHYHIDRGLEFVCLLKSNKKTQIVCKDDQKNFVQQKDVSADNMNTLICEQLQENTQLDISLKKNIFFKEETLQPNKQFEDIGHFKFTTRLFSLTMIVTILALAGINQLQSRSLSKYSSQFISLMNIYRYPFVLDINYMKQFLQIGDREKVDSLISSVSTQLLQKSNKEATAKTIFDENLNVPDIYFPQFGLNLTNKANLSHIDLFFQIVSAVSTLSTSSVNRTSQQYRVFTSYLNPSYNNMMNKTKAQLQQSFDNIFSETINYQMAFLVSQSIVLVLFVLVLFKLIHSFIKKMRNIILILLDFEPSHIFQTYSYWKGVRNNFQKLFLMLHGQVESKKLLQSKYLRESQDRLFDRQLSVNKKAKTIIEDTKKRRFQIKLRVSLVAIMLAILVAIVSLQLQLLTDFQSLRAFENDGFFFLKYFPVATIVARGCVQKHYSDQFPSQITFKPKMYQDALSTMFLYSHNSIYISGIADPSSLYYTKQKNYFFGSPCQFKPSIAIGIVDSVQRCLIMCNGTFKQGISSYLRYAYRLGDRCINNKTALSNTEIDEFTLASTVLSSYILDVMASWTSEFSLLVANLQDQNFTYSVVLISIIIIVHFLIMQGWLIAFLDDEYAFVKQIYLHFVPEFILVKEKVIKQKFVIEGIVSN